mgnify:CR=1 FL=1
MVRIIISMVLVFLIVACGSKNGDSNSSNKVLPPASGDPGEIVIVTDKSKYNGALGDAIKEVFLAEVPGLTREEPMFTLRVIEPTDFNRIFRLSRNLVYIVSLEGNSSADRWLQNTFSKASKELIRNNPDRFMETSENQFAKNQKVLQLFAENDKALAEKIRENAKVIQNYFNNAETERLSESLGMSVASREIVNRIREKLGVSIKVPAEYELAMLQKDFAWMRFLPGRGPSKNLFIYKKNYTSEAAFTEENVIKLRNEVGKKYIFGDPENKASYMVTETKYLDPVFRKINFRGKYTIEMRGAWKTNNFSVGGPFVSYTFVDEEEGILYYVEGFVIHPNEKHRELIREMESLLNTFRLR